MKHLALSTIIICTLFITISCTSQPPPPTAPSSSSVVATGEGTSPATEEELIVTSASIHIDYDNPELYLKSGTQSSLNERYSNEIGTQLSIENNNMKAVAEIFLWKHDYFRTYSAGGKLVGKTTVNQIMEEKMLSGCHDHGLVLVSVFRKYGFPAIMVDTAGIQWALDYSTGERGSFTGHVFVEVYVDNNWILVNSTSGEYVENYDPSNPVIPMTNPDEDKGYFALLKGLDPEGYGITSIQQLKEHMAVFAAGVKSENIHFPKYEVKKLSYSED